MVMYEHSLLVQWPFDGDPTVSVAFCGNKRQFGREEMDRVVNVAGQNCKRMQVRLTAMSKVNKSTRRAQIFAKADSVRIRIRMTSKI